MAPQRDISPLLENITQEMVTALDQEATNGQGWNYYSNGRIVYATVYQNEISGIVREFINDIRVKIVMTEEELQYSCDCNLEGKVCTHIVALLYSWVFDNSEFINMRETMQQLHEFDKDQLIDILERLLLNDPQNVKFLHHGDMQSE